MSSIAIHQVSTGRVRAVPLSGREPVRYRLTRRGRIAVRLLVVCAVSLVMVLGASRVVATDHSGHLATTTVTVKPGATLWQIAARANPNGDIRDTVDEIIKLNALPSSGVVQVGAELAVPVYR